MPRKRAPIFPDEAVTARSGHQPVIPIVLGLSIAEHLSRVICAVAGGNGNARRDMPLVQRRRDISRARSPIVSDQCVPSDAKRRSELREVLSECNELPAAKRISAQEARGAITAQP